MLSYYVDFAVLCLNPRSHKGSDVVAINLIFLHTRLNPRSHKGSDDKKYLPIAEEIRLNPRSHKGSDHIAI